MVPEGWKETTLGTVSKAITSGSRDWAQYYSERGAKFIRMTNLRRSGIHLDLSDLKYVAVNSSSGDGKRTQLRPDDILISITAELGKIGIVPEGIGEAYINQHTALIRIDSAKACPRFVAYLLSSYPMNVQINRMNDSGAKAGLNLPTLRAIRLMLPPLLEQEKLDEILSSWDRAIEAVERLIENSECEKRALMRRLLLGRDRFAKYQGRPPEFVKLKTLCTVRRGASPRPISDPKWFAEAGRGWVRISDVTASQTEHLEATEQYLSDLGVGKSVAVDPGELIMSICATIGVPKVVGVPVCIHDGFVVFRSLDEQLNTSFLYHYLAFYSERLVNSGQPGTQKNLNTTIVGDIEFPDISHKEQADIAAVLDTQDREVRVLKEQHFCLVQEKKALMQQLLTGKRRVKVDRDVDEIVQGASGHG
ncbi:MAG: restriction endonuclease subunit S [Pseudomonadales bacterium]